MHIQRKLGIDLARATAIISVLAAHTTGLNFGVFGVQLFFMVSGYLLADFADDFSPSNFLIHRYLRLAPLAILSTFLFYFRFTNIAEILLNILLIHAVFIGINSFPGGWSISFEWLFSLLNIILVKLKVKVVFTFLIMILLFQLTTYYFTLQNSEFAPHPLVNLINNLGFFVSGHLIKRIGFIVKNNSYLIFILAVTVFINPRPPYNLFLYNISLVLLFLFCLNYRISIKWVEIMIHFIGLRTYGIFLGHFVVMIGLQNSQFFVNLRENMGYFGQLLFFSVVTLGAIFIGYISYKFVEKPIIKLSNKKFRFRD